MDQELTFDGKAYISSKLASQETGYAKDYIGQLCRGKKLDCRMVGRSWYIARNSIRAYETGGEAVVNPDSALFEKVTHEENNIEPKGISRDPDNSGEDVIDQDEIPATFFEKQGVKTAGMHIENIPIEHFLDKPPEETDDQREILIKREISHIRETNLNKEIKPRSRSDILGDINYISDSASLYPTPVRPFQFEKYYEADEIQHDEPQIERPLVNSLPKRSGTVLYVISVALVFATILTVSLFSGFIYDLRDSRQLGNAVSYGDSLGTITYEVTGDGISVNYPSFFNTLASFIERHLGVSQ